MLHGKMTKGSVVATATALVAATNGIPTVAAAVAGIPPGLPYVRMQDLQGIAEPEKAQWISIDKDQEFLPVDAQFLPHNIMKMKKQQQLHLQQQRQLRTHTARKLEEEGDDEAEVEGDDDALNGDDDAFDSEKYNENNPYSVQPFVEGIGEYDEYQQAWRMLGFMIDCNTALTDDEQQSHSRSGDYETTEDGCARYILWAAYVDLEYEGAGIAEYQYWDRSKKKWDNSACQYDDNSRCAKMDCHLEDTHFSLLGFFKHRNYDDWMEQLFKHEGMCVWSEEEYAFMKSARNTWPRGCSLTGTKTTDGQALYFDLKPLPKGRITVGLYSDSQCTVDYSSNTQIVEDILGNFLVNGNGDHKSGDNNGNYDFSGDTLAESMERWESAFSVWNTCHPCVAYDIENTDGTKYTDDDNYYNDDYYNRKRKQRQLGGEYSAQGERFECYDDAGYTNVNQCMKFSAKTTMRTATFRDMSLGRTQGTLVESPLAGFLDSSREYRRDVVGNVLTYFFFITATLCLCYTGCAFWRVKEETNYDLNIRELLVPQGKSSSGSGKGGGKRRRRHHGQRDNEEELVTKGDTEELS